jgi:hypothetical protein
MSNYLHLKKVTGWTSVFVVGLIAGLSEGISSRCFALPPRGVVEEMLSQRSTTGGSASASAENGNRVEVAIESPDGEDEDQPVHAKDFAWLGVSTTEASEVLASQLNLSSGAGLVITYVSRGSPASRAGLQKHDVLVEFDDQALVHPTQLRKLVRAHKVGDTVKVDYFRGGKRQTASVTLGKLAAHLGASDEDQKALQQKLHEIQGQLKDLHIDLAIRDQMNAARQAFNNFQIDNSKVQEEIRNGMEEARKALHEALKSSTNADSTLNPLRKLIEDLAGTSVTVGNNATVTVRSAAKGARSLVNTDDNGTLVIVANPTLHLTAHDKKGKLLFDGEIESADQRDKVPHDVWKRTEPLLDKLNANHAEEPETKE